MCRWLPNLDPRQPRFAGLRMNADEFFKLPDDAYRYELIDGVTVPKVYEDEHGNCPLYNGLRMTAAKYLKLPEDGYKYEVIDGIVAVSPSPMADHQRVLTEIQGQLWAYLKEHPVGEQLPDIDIAFSKDLLYRPDLVYFKKRRVSGKRRRVDLVPDLIVEILSEGTERKNLGQKRADYERFGVLEYWIVNPRNGDVEALRLEGGKYKPVAMKGHRLKSKAIDGFVLDLAAVRRAAR